MHHAAPLRHQLDHILQSSVASLPHTCSNQTESRRLHKAHMCDTTGLLDGTVTILVRSTSVKEKKSWTKRTTISPGRNVSTACVKIWSSAQEIVCACCEMVIVPSAERSTLIERLHSPIVCCMTRNVCFCRARPSVQHASQQRHTCQGKFGRSMEDIMAPSGDVATLFCSAEAPMTGKLRPPRLALASPPKFRGRRYVLNCV